MTDKLQKPNSRQAQEGTLAGQLKGALSKWLRDEVDDMIPARVVAYDDASNRATIQPLVMVGTTEGGKVSRAALPNIPVFRFGSGQFFMRFPIKPGDFGWLKANDNDISLVMQAAGQQEDWPNTERLHDFSDSMFFPDCVRGWLIDGANLDAAVWQSLDGTVCISLHAGKVDIKAPQLIANISGNTEVNCPDIVINASQTTLNSNFTVNGNMAWNGTTSTFNNGGSIDFQGGSISHNGKNIGDTHVHPILGGSSAPGPTGTPQ